MLNSQQKLNIMMSIIFENIELQFHHFFSVSFKSKIYTKILEKVLLKLSEAPFKELKNNSKTV